MPINLGTRTQQIFRKERMPQGSMTKSLTRDVGMSKNVTTSVTFSPGASQIQGGANVFLNTFVAGDPILVEAVNLNNGYFTVTANDGTNLTVDPPPKTEGAITATIRTP